MAYKLYSFSFDNPDEELIDILTAYLSEAGFEGFISEENKLNAYVSEELLETGQPERLLSDPAISALNISYQIEFLPDKNWNAEWESSYSPVIVDDICAIIASFHSIPRNIRNIIHIEPKMSFGTGHHETTRLMVRQMCVINLENKEVLDMGCGTGVLGIFALMQNATFVTAIDIDEWACNNSMENFKYNGWDEGRFRIIQGDSLSLPPKSYHIILANINRNVLLMNMKTYYYHIKKGGLLILSGILISDREKIIEHAKNEGFKPKSEIHENKWISLGFEK